MHSLDTLLKGHFQKTVLDLATPKGLLPRMKTREGLLIRRDFNKENLTRKSDPDIVAELERLRCIEDPTYNGPQPPEAPTTM